MAEIVRHTNELATCSMCHGAYEEWIYIKERRLYEENGLSHIFCDSCLINCIRSVMRSNSVFEKLR